MGIRVMGGATMTDLISRADAIKGIQEGYCACVSDCIDEINKLPNMGTDCTDFIDWIRKVVADEELWELNAVGYGEIICRKLVKIGALATTEKPPCHYVSRADAVQGEWINQDNGAFYPYECSNCHEQPFCDDCGYHLTNYCPNCGARMKGGAE